jgi:phytoene dehydrogenase-like protein
MVRSEKYRQECWDSHGILPAGGSGTLDRPAEKVDELGRTERVDAIVIGAGPNGLSAAIELARAGKKVLVIEAGGKVGGGTRTEELTLPGFRHDVCSAIHGIGIASPFFNSLPLEQYGLEWVHAPAPLAHPFDDGTAVTLERSVADTAEQLGADRKAYRRLMEPLTGMAGKILTDILGPLPIPPRHPLAMARFGLPSLLPARRFTESTFRSRRGRALFAGICAHSIQPLERAGTAGFGLFLGFLAHAYGWPLARGGSQKIADALARYLRTLGGQIRTGWEVSTVDELPPHRSVLFNVTPRQLIHIAGSRLPLGYRRKLRRFRYGPGAFKIDFALQGPIPWKAAEAGRAATVHLGGSFEEIAANEAAVWRGEHPEKPFVLLAQQSQFDPTRAPAGRHTAWAYCHVPNGSTFDMTERIIAQIERFAPGFRDCILAQSVRTPADLEAYNANYIGGDIIGGVQDLPQFWTRPTLSLNPYKIPAKGLYLCSSSTPPGGGVHGMSGYHAARAVLRDS